MLPEPLAITNLMPGSVLGRHRTTSEEEFRVELLGVDLAILTRFDAPEPAVTAQPAHVNLE